jgi:hypothetical protein
MTGERPVTRHPVTVDPRGSLLAVEFAEVPFPVRRLFFVTGPPGGADRGDHRVPCGEAVVLISGTATFEVTSADGATTQELLLDEHGQTVVLVTGDHVRYHLQDEHSRVLVLAEEPYDGGTA